jgi:hypothetical protein
MNDLAIKFDAVEKSDIDFAPAITELGELQLMLIGGGNVEVICG